VVTYDKVFFHKRWERLGLDRLYTLNRSWAKRRKREQLIISVAVWTR